jgi:hypothetical protein
MGFWLLPIPCENTWIFVDCVTYKNLYSFPAFADGSQTPLPHWHRPPTDSDTVKIKEIPVRVGSNICF